MGGTVWFPTTFEWSEAEREYPPQRPAQAAVAVGHGAFVGGTVGSLPHLSGAKRNGNTARRRRLVKQAVFGKFRNLPNSSELP